MKDFIEKNKHLLENDTVIDAGHYSPVLSPDKTDIFVWNIGVSLYKKAMEKNLKNVKLLLLVDDMHELDGEGRKRINIEKLPKEYQKIIDENKVDESDILFVSQNNLRNIGWLYVRRHKKEITESKKFTNISKDKEGNIGQVFLKTDELVLPLIERDHSGKPPIVKCNLIVAEHVKGKQDKGFKNSINLYNVRNTQNGWRIERGTTASRILFETDIKAHNFYFENKKLVGSTNKNVNALCDN
jgi:hypothetical protein